MNQRIRFTNARQAPRLVPHPSRINNHDVRVGCGSQRCPTDNEGKAGGAAGKSLCIKGMNGVHEGVQAPC